MKFVAHYRSEILLHNLLKYHEVKFYGNKGITKFI